jgi:oligopeptidase A
VAELETSRAAIDAIAEPTARTYDNTLGALERATETLEWQMAVVGHLESVATTPELRHVYNRIKPEVSAFFTSINLHEGLYRALEELRETDEARALSGARARFLEKTLADFRRHGAELGPADKERLAELDVELSKATTTFAQNVLDATNAFELIIEDEARLAGLPESARQAAAESAREKGKTGYRFTLHAPSLVPLLTYLDDASIREQVWRAYNTRGTSADTDNRPLVQRILELRRAKATLLGYASFADLVLEDRMAKEGARARTFVADLLDKTVPYFTKENEELAAFRRELEGTDAPALPPWDVGYYSEKLRRSRFDFDEEELREYFPVDRVVAGLFDTVRRLYGIEIEARPGVPVWDRSARAYDVLSEDGAHLGRFFADLHPRENKRGGAWMMGLVVGVPPEPHLGLICANVNPPVGDKPALLTHREVETLFHEFGHLMHHLLSQVDVKSLGATRVAWDFVELPSQIMENWCWERDALDMFARHYETGATIPDVLFEKMMRARTFRAANAQMRQLGFAAADLALHVDWTPEAGDPIAFGRKMMAPYMPTPVPDDYAMIASFTHLFASPVAYASGYYSYKWAEVLDADAFTRFQAEGVFAREVGQAFRDHILASGDSRDPMELYRAFMGREPRVEPLLQRQGLL